MDLMRENHLPVPASDYWLIINNYDSCAADLLRSLHLTGSVFLWKFCIGLPSEITSVRRNVECPWSLWKYYWHGVNKNKTSTGPYRSCAALLDISKPLIWFGQVWFDCLNSVWLIYVWNLRHRKIQKRKNQVKLIWFYQFYGFTRISGPVGLKF